jgi:hypothetical protein
MRRAAKVALIAAASVLGLAACNGPMPISVFSEPQENEDLVPHASSLSNSINHESVRHLVDSDGWRYFAAISAEGYCLIVFEVATAASSSSCSSGLPAYGGGLGPNVQLVPDNYSHHDGDGWTTLTPNLLIQRN